LDKTFEFVILSKKFEKLALKYSEYFGDKNQEAVLKLPAASDIVKKRYP
jgi:hypothetical protein